MPETEKGALNRWFIRYIIALVAIALAFLCRQGIVRYLGSELPPYITFYPTVMLVAVLAGPWAGLLATAVAALVTAYWILPPEGFAIGSLRDVIGLALFSGMGALMSLVAYLYRRARQKAAAYEKELALRGTQEKLRESEARYRSLFENMLEGYAHCQMVFEHGEPQDFIYLDVNKAFERLTGLKDVVGKKVSEVIPGIRQSDQKLFEVYGRVAWSGEPERLETFVESLGIWFSIAVYSPQKGHFVAVFDNITERKRAEEEIRQLNAELEQRVAARTAELAATNQDLEAFTYSVAHDLRAPLRHIGGYSKILVEEFSSELHPTAQHYLQRIEQGAGNMGQLIDELLNLARVGRQELRLQVSGLNSLVEEVRADLQPDHGERQIEWRIGRLPFVECDPVLMKQVMRNLLSNAIKFTRPVKRAVIQVDHKQIGNERAVFVHDNGVGFSMKYADKLFGVFQRLHRPEDFEGTGVGLATVQKIIHKHGGRIWAEAELDRGATFYFTLGTMASTQSENASSAA